MSSRQTILVVEDEQSIREHLVSMLQFEGFDLAAAIDGCESIAKAWVLEPDLIICDLLMSGVNGFGACEVLRDDPETPDISTLLLSAPGAPGDREKVAEFGSTYLTKPFRNQELFGAVRASLTRPQS